MLILRLISLISAMVSPVASSRCDLMLQALDFVFV